MANTKKVSGVALKFLQKERELKRYALEVEEGILHFLEPIAGRGDGISAAMGDMAQGGDMKDLQYEAIRAAWVDEDDQLVLGDDYKQVLSGLPFGDFARLFTAAMQVVDMGGEDSAESGGES